MSCKSDILSTMFLCTNYNIKQSVKNEEFQMFIHFYNRILNLARDIYMNVPKLEIYNI